MECGKSICLLTQSFPLASTYSLPSYIKLDSSEDWPSKQSDNVDNDFLEEKSRGPMGQVQEYEETPWELEGNVFAQILGGGG